jgi:hypothetical protein
MVCIWIPQPSEFIADQSSIRFTFCKRGEVSYQRLDPPRLNFIVWAVFIFLCAPSLLSVPLIDVESGTRDFAMVWLVIGDVNAALYAMIGWVAGKIIWKAESQDAHRQ